jgi:hypothetical protein
MGKVGRAYDGRVFEPYWREQVEGAVTLTRALDAVYGLDPTWLVGHSQVWATKADPGPAFVSMHEMREMVAGPDPLCEHHDILGRFDRAPSTVFTPEPMRPTNDQRFDPECTEATWDVDPIKPAFTPDVDPSEAAMLLYRLGWPQLALGEAFRELVAHFQRSTSAWRSRGFPERVLMIDGQVGPKTLSAMRARVAELRV